MTQENTAAVADRSADRMKRLESGLLRREADTIRAMIAIYCRAHHGGPELCAECRELEEYALKRLSCCPFGAEKPVCAKCKVHCYRVEMRKRVGEVMRFSGPRLLLHHPLLTAEHMWRSMTKPAPDKPRNTKAAAARPTQNKDN